MKSAPSPYPPTSPSPSEFAEPGPAEPAAPAHRPWDELVAFDHCRVLLPQFTFVHRADPVARIQRLALRDPGPKDATFFRRGAARVIFAAVTVRQMLHYFRQYAAFVVRRDGVSRWRQWRDLWYCAWRHNSHPRHYYWRKLYRVPYRTDWLDNLEHRQLMTLLRRLNDHLPIAPALDKVCFHEHCIGQRLPTPSLLAAWNQAGGALIASTRPIDSDLFLKPATEFGSSGILVIPYEPRTGRHTLDGRSLEWPDLMEKLGRRARDSQRTLLLQPRLRNARRAAVYGNFDLCNLRIVTGRAPAGRPEPLAAFIRLPSRLNTTGANRRVLFSIVDITTGRQGPGRFRDIKLGEFPFHPETTARIAGRVIPAWDEMIRLALHAHSTLPRIPFIGWDLVDTPDGIRIVDWEYAGMGNRWFDLGNFAVNNELAPAEEEALLTAYLGAPPAAADLAALRLMRLMSDFREAMWGVVQRAISDLDVDFDDYATKHFDRLLAAIDDDDFEALLGDAGAAR